MNYKSCYISCPLLKIKLQHFSNSYKFSFLILYPNLRKLLLSLLLALHCGGGKSSQLAHHQLVLSQCRNEKLSKRERNLILCGGGSCIRYCEWISFLIQAHRQSESEILEHSLKIEEFYKKTSTKYPFWGKLKNISRKIRSWIIFSTPACFANNLKYWWMIQDQKKTGRDFLSTRMLHHSD